MNIKKFLVGTAAGVFMLTSTVIPAFAESSLVGFWKLNGDAADSSSYGNNGTTFGGVTFVAGMFGQAAQFDGSTGYISAPHSLSLDITNQIMVDGWIKLNSLSQQATVASKWDDLTGNNRGYLLAVHTDGSPRFYISTNGINFPAAIGPALSLNTWYRLTGTYDGSTISLYVDGVLVATTAWVGTINSNSQDLLIGANDGFGGANRKFTDGLVDNVRIWNVADITLTVLPTDMNQCKKGGWESYGVFKNQGDCVSYVATGGKNPPANQ